jgi:hypothetical protein
VHVSLPHGGQPRDDGSYIHTALPAAPGDVGLVMARLASCPKPGGKCYIRSILKTCVGSATASSCKGHRPFEQLRPDRDRQMPGFARLGVSKRAPVPWRGIWPCSNSPRSPVKGADHSGLLGRPVPPATQTPSWILHIEPSLPLTVGAPAFWEGLLTESGPEDPPGDDALGPR